MENQLDILCHVHVGEINILYLFHFGYERNQVSSGLGKEGGEP
jgi:hypothetical protein